MLTILSDYRKIIYTILAFMLFGIILILPQPDPIQAGEKLITLSIKGKATLAALSLAVLLWVTEGLPFAVTGLLAMVMLVMTGAAGFKELIKDGFGNHIILFFIGVLIFSSAIGRTSLLKRMAMKLLKRLGHSPRLIILVFISVGAFLSGWITDMAVAAMLMPIGVSILKDAGLKPLESNFGRALLIACAWGPLIGGISTPAGCGPNPLTIGFLKDMAGIDFTFLQWMAIGYPAMIMMIPFGWIILIKVFPLEDINLTLSEEDIEKQRLELGKISFKEIAVIVIFIITIALWILGPFIKTWTGGAIDFLSISYVAIGCSLLFFLPGLEILSWKEAETDISWGGIILIVTGLALGMAIYKTGAAEWVAWISFRAIGSLHPAMIIFVIVIGVSLLKVMFSSNSVTGIIVVPLLIALAGTLNLDPALLAIPAGITSSLAFILVTSTPTNVIPYSSGYFSIGDMVKAGIFMTIASSLVVTVSVYGMGRILGILS